MVTPDHDKSTPIRFEAQLAELLAELNNATARLASSREADEEVTFAVHRLAQTLSETNPEWLGGSDPYLVQAFLLGAVACADANSIGDGAKKRQQLRIPLERTRQALRDLLAERSVAQDEPAKQVVRWMVEVSQVPQHELADLIGVSPRTFQRWVSPAESAAPSGAEETRVRTLARTIDQLRWSMTPAGVVRWLQRPHPMLDGKAPIALLDEPGAYADLPRLGATARAMVAS